MRVHVMSKKSFDDLMRSNGIDNDNVEDQKDTFFVSINNTSSESTYFTDKANVKVMFFDDTETDLDVPIIGTGKTEHKKAFTPDQARDLKHVAENGKGNILFFDGSVDGMQRAINQINAIQQKK